MTEADPSLTDVQCDWLRHVRACDAAGTTMRAYATEHGLNLDAFCTAKMLLRRKGALGSPTRNEKPRFARARVVDGRSPGRGSSGAAHRTNRWVGVRPQTVTHAA